MKLNLELPLPEDLRVAFVAGLRTAAPPLHKYTGNRHTRRRAWAAHRLGVRAALKWANMTYVPNTPQARRGMLLFRYVVNGENKHVPYRTTSTSVS